MRQNRTGRKKSKTSIHTIWFSAIVVKVPALANCDENTMERSHLCDVTRGHDDARGKWGCSCAIDSQESTRKTKKTFLCKKHGQAGKNIWLDCGGIYTRIDGWGHNGESAAFRGRGFVRKVAFCRFKWFWSWSHGRWNSFGGGVRCRADRGKGSHYWPVLSHELSDGNGGRRFYFCTDVFLNVFFNFTVW